MAIDLKGSIEQGVNKGLNGLVDNTIGLFNPFDSSKIGNFPIHDEMKRTEKLIYTLAQQAGIEKGTKRMMDLQASYQKELMKYQSELNSPGTIAKELASAGFNPYVAMGSGSGTSGGQVGAGSVSLPEAAYGTIGSQVGLMDAQTLAQLAQAHKTTEEGSMVRRSIESMIQDVVSRSRLNEAEKNRLEFGLALDKMFSKKERSQGINEIKSRIEKNYSDAWKAQTSGDLDKAQTAILSVQRDIEELRKTITSYQEREAFQHLERYAEILEADIKNKRSETAKNYAQGREASASAEGMEFFNEIRKQPEIRRALCSQIIMAAEQAQEQKNLTHEQTELIKWQAKQLEKATDNYEIQMWSTIINQTLHTVIEGVGEFTRFGMVKKFLDAKPSPIESGRGYMMQDGVLMLNPIR